MKRLLMTAWVLAIAALPLGPATAGTEALVALDGADDVAWERRVAVQDLLRGHYGFDQVKVLVDSTAEELPGRVRKFLEAPRSGGDRRLVWISGLTNSHGKTVCPGPGTRPIRPAAPSLILAPACYGKIIRFPQGARHYGLTAPEPRQAAARVGRIDAADPALIAFLTLPVGDPRFVAGADTLVLDALKAGSQRGVIDPVRLLTQLRTGFRWNGSAYTPSLDLFHRGVETDNLGPFGFLPRAQAGDKLKRIRPVRRLRGPLRVHDNSRGQGGPALTVRRAGPVRVLRADKSGAMRYVALGDSLFGWVENHDLRL